MKVNRKRLTQVVNILIGILNCHPKSSYYIFVKSEVTFCYKTTTVGGPLQISNHWRARLLTSQRCKHSRLDPSLSVSQQVLYFYFTTSRLHSPYLQPRSVYSIAGQLSNIIRDICFTLNKVKLHRSLGIYLGTNHNYY